MKKQRLTILFVVPLAVVLFATFVMAASSNNVNGAACRAANLKQAGELAWDHARVSNPGSRSLWVLCPMERPIDFVEDSGNILKSWVINSLSVRAWFGASADPAAQVTCIVREMDTDVTNTSAVNAVNHAIAQTGGGLPEVVSQTFDMTGAANHYDPYTVACQLPPGTGINAIHMTNSWVDNTP